MSSLCAGSQDSFLPGLRPRLGFCSRGLGSDVLAQLPSWPAPPLCIYWFSLNVPITQASGGHQDKNKSHKAVQPEAGNPIPPQRPEEAPVESMPDHSGPHTPHGHDWGHAPTHPHVHWHTFTCSPPHPVQDLSHTRANADTHALSNASYTASAPAHPCRCLTHTHSHLCLTARLSPSCDHTRVTDLAILKVLVGKTNGRGCAGWEDEAGPMQFGRRVASWEHRPRTARASEFFREAGKLNFYVKYPDF